MKGNFCQLLKKSYYALSVNLFLFVTVCFYAIYLSVRFLYHENTQNHVEKPVCIFISVGGQDILSACVDAQAGLDPAMPV